MNKQQTLNQVVAVEKGAKSRAESAVTAVFQAAKKESLWNGFSKQYSPKDDEGEKFPDERQRVQFNAVEALQEVARHWGEVLDLTLTKDCGNGHAAADLIVGGAVLGTELPAVTLLALEKKMVAIKEFFEALPVLDEAEEWDIDPNTGLYRTRVPAKTHKTKKVLKVLTLAAATEKHPAQAKEYTEDEIVGWWSTTKHSGALPLPRKKALLERIDQLTRAVKMARESANSQDAPPRKLGSALFDWLLRP